MVNVELTAAQAADLRGAQTAVDSLERDIARLEASGLDVSALRERLERAKTVRAGLLANFTPGSRARGTDRR